MQGVVFFVQENKISPLYFHWYYIIYATSSPSSGIDLRKPRGKLDNCGAIGVSPSWISGFLSSTGIVSRKDNLVVHGCFEINRWNKEVEAAPFIFFDFGADEEDCDADT